MIDRGVTRRDAMAAAAGAVGVAGLARVALAQVRPGDRSFPKDFVWGAATCGHQIEGNDINSDDWVLENARPSVFAEPSGDACDSYHRYEEDIALLAWLGLGAYRFSIQWSRIEPEPGAFSNAEIDHYKRMIETCHRYGVRPAVTFLHGTAPVWFAASGGWTNPDAPDLFARFCARSAKALADGMSFAFTLNEPQITKVVQGLPGASSYLPAQKAAQAAAYRAAGRSVGSKRFSTIDEADYARVEPQLMAAHRQSFAAIRSERGNLPTGLCLAILDLEPGGDDSPYLALRRTLYSDWLKLAADAGNFIGVQTYHLVRVPGRGAPYPPFPPTPDQNLKDPMSALQQPQALGNAVDYVHAETGMPILVTENGLEADNDARRVWYIDATLARLRESVARGVPVQGYFHWSLLDNFEWGRGYKPKFGLVAVDRTNFKRTPKPSALHYGNIARANAI